MGIPEVLSKPWLQLHIQVGSLVWMELQCEIHAWRAAGWRLSSQDVGGIEGM